MRSGRRNFIYKEMATRTVKFSDLLTRPAEFVPLDAPPSPSSLLETISSTVESDPDADVPSQSAPPEAATNEEDVAASPASANQEDSAERTEGTEGAGSFPARPASADVPKALEVSLRDGEDAEAKVGDAADAQQQPVQAAVSSDASTSGSMSSAPLGAVSEAPPPDQQLPERTPPSDVPDASDLEAPGSLFNLQGMQRVFPMQPTAIPGFSVVPAAEAPFAARSLGLAAKVDFRIPSATRLEGGAVLVAAPTGAVSLARLSEPCSKALQSVDVRPSISAVLELVRKFAPSTRDDMTTVALADALGRLQATGVLACDPVLEASMKDLRNFFGKLKASVERCRASELTYLRHADELAARKRDLQALVEVAKADAQLAKTARDKLEAARMKWLPSVVPELSAAARKLQLFARLAETLKDLPPAA